MTLMTPPGGAGGGVSDIPNAGPQDFSQYNQPAWQRNRPGNPVEAVRFGKRYVDNAEPVNNMEQPSQWQGRTVGQEGQHPLNRPVDTRNVGMPGQQRERWKNRSVSRPEDQQQATGQQQPLLGTDNTIYVEPNSPAQRGETTFGGQGFEQQTNPPYRPEPQPRQPAPQQSPKGLTHSPTHFTGNRHGTVDADSEAVQQDSQQRRADRKKNAPNQHPGSPEYTGDPDKDLASYTERLNSLNRLFRSFNWKKGDEGKKRRVRKLIENQRKLEMQARKSGRGITPLP